MTVSTENTYSGPYYPNGVTVAFPFTFKALSTSEVAVATVTNGVETLVDEAVYSVTLADPADPGGTVTFTTAPAATIDELYVLSEPLFTQTSAFTNQGAFLPAVFNMLHDRAAIRDQYLKEKVDRAILLPRGGGVEGLFPFIKPGGTVGFSSGTGADDGLRGDMANPVLGASLLALALLGSATAAKSAEEALSVWRWVDRGGALGNGVADDTAKIQAVIDEAGDGAVLIFNPGSVYRINTNYQPTDGGVMGGLKILDNQTWFLNGAELKALVEPNGGGSVVQGYTTTGWKIFGGKITGEKDIHVGTTGEWGHGISAWTATDWTIDGVEISNCWGDGIYVGADNEGEYCERFAIRNCHIHHASRNGISVVNGRDGTIENNVIHDVNRLSPLAAIDLEPNLAANRNERIKVIGNTGYNVSVGLYVTVANKDIEVSGNHFVGTASGLLFSDNTTNLRVEGNLRIESTTGGAEGASIRAVLGTPSTVNGVTIKNNSLYGGGFFNVDIPYAGALNVKIDDNRIHASNASVQGFARLSSGSFIGNECVLESNAGVSGQVFVQFTSGVTIGRNRYTNNSALTLVSSMSGITNLGGENYASSTLRRGSSAGSWGPAEIFGITTLGAGTVTIADTRISASSRIFANHQTDAGTPGIRLAITRIPGTSFTITSKKADGTTETADTSTVTYLVLQPLT